jgi:hypothetical protein
MITPHTSSTSDSKSLLQRKAHTLAVQRASKAPPNWWTPLWRGLVADPESKHRKAMGASAWLFLYLLMYANRKTGIVRRSLGVMHSDTGYPIRTIQSHLRKLRLKGYITTKHSGHYLKITIAKWKAFHHPSKAEPRSDNEQVLRL